MPYDVSNAGMAAYSGISATGLLELADAFPLALSEEDLVSFGPALAALSDDAELLPRYFQSYADLIVTSAAEVAYTPQSFLLARGKRAYVRANIWIPSRFSAALRTQEDKIFSYRLAHDHNFAFLTAGHFGPGYDTDLWEYDPSKVEGHAGESVDLRPLGRTRLTKDRLLLYREKVDVHTQLPPEALSVSLNVIPAPAEEAGVKDQYIFDTSRGQIESVASMAVPSKRVSIVQLAAYIAHPNVVDTLSNVVKEAASWRVREAAMASCIANPASSPSLRNSVIEQGLRDVDHRVRAAAERNLACCQERLGCAVSGGAEFLVHPEKEVEDERN